MTPLFRVVLSAGTNEFHEILGRPRRMHLAAQVEKSAEAHDQRPLQFGINVRAARPIARQQFLVNMQLLDMDLERIRIHILLSPALTDTRKALYEVSCGNVVVVGHLRRLVTSAFMIRLARTLRTEGWAS